MKRVYLSFSGADTQKVKKLLPLLASPEYELDFYDGEIDADMDSPEAETARHLIGEKIVKCSAAVCLISEETHNSKRVGLELSKNRNKGNRIIAMALKKTESAVLPAVIKEENLTFYPWDPERLKELLGQDSGKIFNNSL